MGNINNINFKQVIQDYPLGNFIISFINEDILEFNDLNEIKDDEANLPKPDEKYKIKLFAPVKRNYENIVSYEYSIVLYNKEKNNFLICTYYLYPIHSYYTEDIINFYPMRKGDSSPEEIWTFVPEFFKHRTVEKNFSNLKQLIKASYEDYKNKTDTDKFILCFSFKECLEAQNKNE